jgi:hypothetical protein
MKCKCLAHSDGSAPNANRSPQEPSVDAKYGEGYAEYIGELGDTVDAFADWNDSRQVCIFVHEPYNPESRFASKIADHATVTIPCLLQMSKSDIESDRAQSIPVLPHALAKRQNAIDRQTATAIHQAILDGLQDPSVTVRSETIASVGNFGSKDLIPALTNIAVSDPASDRNPETNVQSFPVREAAMKCD